MEGTEADRYIMGVFTTRDKAAKSIEDRKKARLKTARPVDPEILPWEVL